MSLATPCPVGPKGRPAAILALPPEGAWPPPDTLITRRQLAELYGVTVEVIRALERRGKGPPKVTNLKRGDFSPALYRCAEVKSWLDDMVAAQDAPPHSLPCFPPNPSNQLLTTAPPVRPRRKTAFGSSKGSGSRMNRGCLRRGGAPAGALWLKVMSPSQVTSSRDRDRVGTGDRDRCRL